MINKLSNNKDFFSYLPVEVFLQILNFINIKDLLSCSQVSKRWHKLSNDHLLWLKKCIEINIPKLTEFQDLSLKNGSLKEKYLYYTKLVSNWQCGDEIVPVLVPVHRDHIITGLVVYDNWVVSCSDDGTVAVLDMMSGQTIRLLRGHRGGVWSLVAFSIANQPLIATSSTDCTIRVWHLLSGECIRIFVGHSSTVRCLATSLMDSCGDNMQLISGSRDTTLRVWDVYSGHCVHVLSGHDGAVRCVRADGRHVVSGSYDHSIRIWDVKNGHCLFVLIGHTNRVYTLYLGRQIILSASLDTNLRVWDSTSGTCTHILSGHRSLTCEIAMNSDESLVVSGNADNSVRVWLISTGECILILDGVGTHLSALTSVQIVLDRFIVSSGTDGTVKLWNLRDGSFIRDILQLEYAYKGGVVWRSSSTNGRLVCAVGSHDGFEITKLYLFDFTVKKKRCDEIIYNPIM